MNLQRTFRRQNSAPKIPTLEVLATPRMNRWACACGWDVVTIEHVDGTTPFMLRCRGCGGFAQSTGYKDDKFLKQPTMIWRQPTITEYRKLDAQAQDHVQRGGLLDYPLATVS